jgi:hypothetical protein
MLAASGEVALEGERLRVYQCDECLEVQPVFGEPFEMAYTFAVTESGQIVALPDDPPDAS